MAPIVTVFDANFDKFTSAVNGAEAQLRSFTVDADKVASSLGKMTDSFSGQKVVQQALLMTEAVERIGGAGMLTDKELQKIAPTIQEAIDKMKKLGQEVPANLQKLGNETKNVGSSLFDIGKIAGELAGPLVALFSVQQVISFGKDVLAAGDAIQKMADQTGLATDQVQQLQYIAGQSGTSVESLVSAAQNLQAKLGAGDAGVSGAIRALNINLEDFQKLGTYEQMTQLSTAITGLDDPTKQAAAAAAVFGKNWKEILPAMKSDMAKLGEEAPKMSKEAVQALDEIGDSLTGAYQAAIALGGEGVLHVTNFLKAVYDFQSRFDLSHLGSSVSEMIPPIEQATELLKKAKPPQQDLIDGFHAITLSAQETAAIIKQSDDEQAARVEQQKKDSDAKIAMKKAEEQAARDLAAAEKAYWDGVAAIMEKATGREAIDAASKWNDAIKLLQGDLTHFSNTDLRAMYDALQAGVAAMIANGTASSDLGVELHLLMLKAQEAAGGIKAVTVAADDGVGAVTAFTRNLYDLAKAEDAERNARGGVSMTGGSDATSGPYIAPSGNQGGSTFNADQANTSGSGAGSSYYLPPRRAAGGPVSAGTSYLVGERGPELFTPGASGLISPGGAIVNNVFNLVDTESNLARRVSEQILRSVTQARRV
jgi:hypothetical protein